MNPGSKKTDFDIWQLDANFPVVSAVHWIKMGVYYDVLSASQVTDVNGNWVQYTYDANKRLQSITSSDGRRIDIGRTGNQVGTVTANPGTVDARQWTYSYGWKTSLHSSRRHPSMVWEEVRQRCGARSLPSRCPMAGNGSSISATFRRARCQGLATPVRRASSSTKR